VPGVKLCGNCQWKWKENSTASIHSERGAAAVTQNGKMSGKKQVTY
jgi:hypothetical protein